MIHHGYQQVDQYNDVYDRVGAEHEHAPEPREYLDSLEFEALELDKAEYRPEERLYGFEETERIKHTQALRTWLFEKLNFQLLCKSSPQDASVCIRDEGHGLVKSHVRRCRRTLFLLHVGVVPQQLIQTLIKKPH